MKVILAQGNPGQQYTETRHNIGWLVLDALAAQTDAQFLVQAKFHAHIAEVTIQGEKTLLVKPTTFYNETGRTARALVDFYKLDPATDLLVIHDDLALPFGTIRVREKGSDAGNNGIKSLNAHIGPEYARLRVGIWNDLRERMDDAAFVLARFSKDEMQTLDKDIIPHAIKLVEDFCRGTLQTTSHKLV